MKIAMISEGASPLAIPGGDDAGGQGIYVANVARQFARLGHVVDIFTRRDAPRLPPLVEMTPGVRVVHVPAGPAAPVSRETALDHVEEFSAYLLRFFERERRQRRKYTLAHANFFTSGLPGLKVKRVFGVPLVVSFHGLGRAARMLRGMHDGFPDQRIAIEEALVQESDRVVAECAEDRKDILRLYGGEPRRIAVVPCGFDVREFFPLDRDVAREALSWDPRAFTVLQLGRLLPHKGVDNIIRAVGILRRAYGSDARLCVVGGNSEQPDEQATPEIARLRAIATEEGVSDLVSFVGRHNRELLHVFYCAADVFVTTPWHESSGMTPIEAMACARPVIGANLGGAASTIVDGITGYLVPPREPRLLADRLRELMQDADQGAAMGAAGRAEALSTYTWESVTRALAEVYAAALRASPPPRPAGYRRPRLRLVTGRAAT